MKHLLTSRSFQSLFWTQFLAAFNDNFFKNLLVMWLTFSSGLPYSNVLVTAAAGIFILPYVFFSPLAGQLADKYPKHLLIRITQGAEVGIMGCALAGFALESAGLLLFTLFLMGMQSTLFGPVKYSILPDLFQGSELVAVNSWWTGGTFVAIVLGTLAGTGGYLLTENDSISMMLAVLAVSGIGFLAALFVPAVSGSNPHLKLNWHVWRAFLNALRFARYHHGWWVMLAISGFWMLGAMVLSQVPLMAETLNAPEYTLWLLLLFACMMGLGAACAYLLNRKTLRLKWTGIWYGVLIIALLMLIWAWPHTPSIWWAAFAVLAFVGGLLVVPLYVWLQKNVDAQVRGRVFATLNVLNALFMIAGAIGLMLWHAGVN